MSTEDKKNWIKGLQCVTLTHVAQFGDRKLAQETKDL